MENKDINIKHCINISTSWFKREIFWRITIGQIIFIIACCVINLSISIILFKFINLIAGFIFLFLFLIFTIIFSIKKLVLFKIFINFIKYVFNFKKTEVKNIESSQSILKFKDSSFVFFEINCNPLYGTETQIHEYVNYVIKELSLFKNFSIINSILPYSNLHNNKNNIDKMIEKFIENNEFKNSNPILRNLLANKYLIEQFLSGNIPKQTFIIVFELNKFESIKSLLNRIELLNKSLLNQKFEIQRLSNEGFEYFKNELFLLNKKIHIKKTYIESDNNYYHFAKIENLPLFLDVAFLNFLNELNDDEININFSINLYSLKKQKYEDKIWESAIRYSEYQLNKAKKNKEIVQAEDNFEAIQEIVADLTRNKSSTQKFEILIQIKTNNKKALFKAKRNIYQIIKRNYNFELENTSYNQFSIFNSFQRNIFRTNKFKQRKTMNVLPTDLILWSYPFLDGNMYNKDGLYFGTLFNGNPLFFNLNKGSKINNSSLIVGKTGSGKSTFINFIIKNNMSFQNIKTIVLDPKGEYVLNEEILKMNPQIINISNNDDLVLNPFEISLNERIEQKIDFIINFIKSFFENEWKLEYKNILINAITFAIKNNSYNMDYIYKYLKSNEIAKRHTLLIDTIFTLTSKGIYSYFTKSTNINISSNLIIFNLNDVLTNYSALTKAKLLLLFKFLKNTIYNQQNMNFENNTKIQIIVDEFPALANPTAPFIVTEFVSMVRLVRSYDASVILAMQDMVRLESQDIGSNESLKAIANSVSHKFIMKMNQEQLEIMKRIWGDSVELTSQEANELTTKFNYGDILYLNDQEKYYFNATDPLSKWSDFDLDEIEDYINNEFNKKNNMEII